MTYPIEMSRTLLTYSDGNRSNKFYELTILTDKATGQSVLLRRFGKKGALGTLMSENHPTRAKAEKSFEEKFRKETRKGYSVESGPSDFDITNETEFRNRIGVTIWPTLPGTVFDHLGLSYDPSKRRKELPDLVEDPVTGKMVPKAQTFSQDEINADLERQEREKEAARLAKVQRGYAANPMFGRF